MSSIWAKPVTEEIGFETTLHGWDEAREVARSDIRRTETFYLADLELCFRWRGRPSFIPGPFIPGRMLFRLQAETTDDRRFSHMNGVRYPGRQSVVSWSRPFKQGECVRGPIGFVIPRMLRVERLTYQTSEGSFAWEL